MPRAEDPLRRLGFLTIGLFDADDPGPGHETTLQLIELGERLGLDSAWLRHRHLQHGISSPVAVLAAASQRTSRIDLGTAVTPLGWENPLRLAEDLATLDVLAPGRINPGVSVGPPMQWEHVRDALYPDTAEAEDFTPTRVERLVGLLRGGRASSFSGTQGIETFSERVEPHSPGLADRVWYGAGSRSSARWAGEAGLHLLTSSVVRAEDELDGPPDFAALQVATVLAYREARGAQARVSQGLVVIPTDGASDDQVRRYREYADARLARTRAPQGPGRLVFAPDLVGPADELADQLRGHGGYQQADEVAFALPFTFGHEDYVQILTAMATRLGPDRSAPVVSGPAAPERAERGGLVQPPVVAAVRRGQRPRTGQQQQVARPPAPQGGLLGTDPHRAERLPHPGHDRARQRERRPVDQVEHEVALRSQDPGDVAPRLHREQVLGHDAVGERVDDHRVRPPVADAGQPRPAVLLAHRDAAAARQRQPLAHQGDQGGVGLEHHLARPRPGPGQPAGQAHPGAAHVQHPQRGRGGRRAGVEQHGDAAYVVEMQPRRLVDIHAGLLAPVDSHHPRARSLSGVDGDRHRARLGRTLRVARHRARGRAAPPRLGA